LKKPTKTELHIQELREWIAHNEERIKQFPDHSFLVASMRQDIEGWQKELASLGYRENPCTKTCSSEGIFFEVAS
jgi:hypothetical protein